MDKMPGMDLRHSQNTDPHLCYLSFWWSGDTTWWMNTPRKCTTRIFVTSILLHWNTQEKKKKLMKLRYEKSSSNNRAILEEWDHFTNASYCPQKWSSMHLEIDKNHYVNQRSFKSKHLCICKVKNHPRSWNFERVLYVFWWQGAKALFTDVQWRKTTTKLSSRCLAAFQHIFLREVKQDVS